MRWIIGFALAVASAVVAAAPSAKTKEIITGRCALCHGLDGESASAVYPRLAAQHPEYLRKQLADFRDGRRKSDTMNEMARDLDDTTIQELAEYFASKPAHGRSPADADLAAVGKYLYHKGNRFSGVPACVTCHGENGHGTSQLPRLAGQHPRYLETQLAEFNKRQRTNDNAIMHSIAAKLTAFEAHALAAYLGSLK